jgi:hypothetical protein
VAFIVAILTLIGVLAFIVVVCGIAVGVCMLVETLFKG